MPTKRERILQNTLFLLMKRYLYIEIFVISKNLKGILILLNFFQLSTASLKYKMNKIKTIKNIKNLFKLIIKKKLQKFKWFLFF